MALTPLQERLAALVVRLPEAAGFVLAGGAALAAHGLLDRATRDLDYFGAPDAAGAVHRLADAFERAVVAEGFDVSRDRQSSSFIRLRVASEGEECEVDLGIDYRALDPVSTRYGPALELRELGANKVLAIFGRAEPRDFMDLAELTKHFPLAELIGLAADKDPGLDLAVLDEFMQRASSLPREEFELDDDAYEGLLDTVRNWRTELRRLRELELDGPDDTEPGQRLEP